MKETQMNTPRAIFIKLMPFILGLLTVSFAWAQAGVPASGELKWGNAPASWPAGARVAMLKGNLAKAGPFAFRLKLPAGYRLRPQSSSAIQRIVVVSGALNLGSGNSFDEERTIPFYAGYVHLPDKSPYFAFTTEETVVEIEGTGPFAVTYVNPADDPANRKRISRSTTR
jgi:hypothetical protein